MYNFLTSCQKFACFVILIMMMMMMVMPKDVKSVALNNENISFQDK